MLNAHIFLIPAENVGISNFKKIKLSQNCHWRRLCAEVMMCNPVSKLSSQKRPSQDDEAGDGTQNALKTPSGRVRGKASSLYVLFSHSFLLLYRSICLSPCLSVYLAFVLSSFIHLSFFSHSFQPAFISLSLSMWIYIFFLSLISSHSLLSAICLNNDSTYIIIRSA